MKSMILTLAWVYAVVTFWSCSLGPEVLSTQQTAKLSGKSFKKIAIAPVASAFVRKEEGRGGEPKKDDAPLDSGPLMTGLLYEEMRKMAGWQVIPEGSIRTVASALKFQELNNQQAREIGRQVQADGVLFGRVLRYRDRQGRGWGSEYPASVAFSLFLLDVKTGQVAWSARFDETEKPLSENILNAYQFFAERKTRWRRADEILREGVTRAVRDLHNALFPAT